MADLRERLLAGTAAHRGLGSSLGRESLSVTEAAALAGISRTFIYERIRTGELPTVKLGKRRLVRVEALRRWLESLETRVA